MGSILISALPFTNFPTPESVKVISGDSGAKRILPLLFSSFTIVETDPPPTIL